MSTMAYLTQRGPARWELRESITTERGPRSRTLASFDVLTDGVLRQAAARATRPLDPGAVRAAARRAAVPVELPAAEQAARHLASELAQGATLPPALSGVLASLLSELVPSPAPVSDSAKAAAQWADATPRDRADALHDLLLLADALPSPRRAAAVRTEFPRFQSLPAAPTA